MRCNLLIAVMILASVCAQPAFAQKKQVVISGTVISAEESRPLEGAIIVEKGTKNITGTMTDGQFSLSVAPQDTIIVHIDGYETKQIKITDETYYPITLRVDKGPERLNAKLH